MKRIIFCIALSVISLAVAIGSFLTNDVVSYKNWIRDNAPKAADSFDKHMRRAPDEKHPPRPEKKHEEHKAEMKQPPRPPTEAPRPEAPKMNHEQ